MEVYRKSVLVDDVYIRSAELQYHRILTCLILGRVVEREKKEKNLLLRRESEGVKGDLRLFSREREERASFSNVYIYEPRWLVAM